MSKALPLCHNTYNSQPWGHSPITLSQNFQNLEPPRICSILVAPFPSFSFERLELKLNTHPSPSQSLPPLPPTLIKKRNLKKIRYSVFYNLNKFKLSLLYEEISEI